MSTRIILGEKYIINGKSADVSGFIPDMSADIYYEVVRLIDGKLLFLQEHLDRLRNSLTGSGISFPGKDTLLHNLSLLLEQNSFTQGNIRICVQPSTENGSDLLCYFISYVYPDAVMYTEGVSGPIQGLKNGMTDSEVLWVSTSRNKAYMKRFF
jgi:branched-chain amino acid aminotransferase